MRESAIASALRLAEDALALTRSVNAFAWAIYAAGMVPFFGLLLLDVTDIARSPIALERLLMMSFALALCFVWMHACQAMYSAALLAEATDTEFVSDRRRWVSTVCIQAALQPAKLIAWPFALALLVPHGAVTMFFQHALLAGAKGHAKVRDVMSEAADQAGAKKGESYCFLGIVLLLRILLWTNLLVLLVTLPALWHMFTGIDTAITRRPTLLLNPTSWVALLSLCYLALDPTVKAACVLRALARESRRSGLDLRIRLARLRSVGVVGVMAIMLCMGSRVALGNELSNRGQAISPNQMKAAINSVFHDPSLSWDLPVARKRGPPKNVLYSFVESAYDKVTDAWRSAAKWMGSLEERLRRWLAGAPQATPNKDTVPEPWGIATAVEALAIMIGTAMALMLWRSRSRRPVRAEAMAENAGAPIMESAELDSGTRPQEEWLALAEEYAISGNLRMALRGSYLASLAALSDAGLISTGKGKSNLDYLREMQRRSKRGPTEVASLMRTNVNIFERVWYGEHDIDQQTYAAFRHNAAEMRRCL